MKDFDQVIRLLEDYKREYRDLLVPYRYTTENGVHLGRLVDAIRSGNRKTTADEKSMLNKLGFVWKVKESPRAFEEVVKLLEEYKKQKGDLLVPRPYIAENGIHLGAIVHSIRSGSRKTSENEKAMLNNLEFVWKIKESLSFDEVIKLLKEYREQYGNLLVPIYYTTENGVKLGNVVSSIRSGSRKTSENEKAMLNKLGFVWKIRESSLPFEEVIKLLKEYKEQYGNLLVPYRYTTENGVHLGDIVHSIRSGNRKTSEEEKEILDSIGFIWNKK